MITQNIDISKDVGLIIEKKLKEALEEEVNCAIQRFEERKGEIVAGLLVRMMRSTEMRIMQDRIVFEIINPELT